MTDLTVINNVLGRDNPLISCRLNAQIVPKEGPPTPPSSGFLLLESGDSLLLESGDFIIITE